jgi:hypothetical protein
MCVSNARRRFRHPRSWSNISVNSMERSGFVRRQLSLQLLYVDHQPLESQGTWKLTLPHHLPRPEQPQQAAGHRLRQRQQARLRSTAFRATNPSTPILN